MRLSRHLASREARGLVAASNAAGSRVRARELELARQAVAMLPAADRALLRALGLRVELVPQRSLEDGMLGATNIIRDESGRWSPIRIRVACRSGGVGAESLAEVVQHEVGHAISVARSQDRTEDAAGRYARAH